MEKEQKVNDNKLLEDRFLVHAEGTTVDVPFFQTNEEWYYLDENDYKLKLTDKAPQEAYASYEQWLNELNSANKENKEQSQAMSLFGLQGGQNNGMQQ